MYVQYIESENHCPNCGQELEEHFTGQFYESILTCPDCNENGEIS